MGNRNRKSAIPEDAPTTDEHVRWTHRWVPIVVAVVTILVFSPALRNGFVAWDDDQNFLTNLHYRGLGLEQLRWMWTTFHLGHYVPLSWMTLGLDHVVWGMNPVGYHLTNILLHAANAVLVYFLAIRLYTLASSATTAVGAARPFAAAAAALIFSLHPLRVESVAWITERRDVLSAFFFLLSILQYLRSRGASPGHAYARSLGFFVCALLSKGSVVTLPAILLVLNVYPLRRLGGGAGWWNASARRVYGELAPFALLSAGAAMLTLVALQDLAPLGFGDKITVSIYSLVFYLRKTLLPVGLSPLYGMPSDIVATEPRFVFAGAAAVATVAVLWLMRRRPSVLAAAALFVIALAPFLGIVQNGPQIAADRYTYFAAPALAVLAGAALLGIRSFTARVIPAALVLFSLAVLTWRQTHVCRDSEALWAQVLRVEPDSPIGHNNWGNVLSQRRELDEAIRHYSRAIELSPRYAEAHNNLGVSLLNRGRATEAVGHFRRALEIEPAYVAAQLNWGLAAIRMGNPTEAVQHYQLALSINPASADAHTNWGNALVRLGRPAEAERHYAEAVGIRPDNAAAYHNWGVALAVQGKLAEAIPRFRRTLAIDPAHPEAQAYLARAIELNRSAGGR